VKRALEEAALMPTPVKTPKMAVKLIRD
jgi:hypothetical protein